MNRFWSIIFIIGIIYIGIVSGCSIKKGLFKAADKNDDGMLTRGEAKKATSYLFNRRRCPEMSDVRG